MSTRRIRVRAATGSAAFLATYVLAAWLGSATPGIAEISPWWLPAPLGLWLMVRHGVRTLPVVVLGELLVTSFLFHASIDVLAVASALANQGSYAVAAAWVRRHHGAVPDVDKPRVLLDLLTAGAGGAVLAAVSGVPLMLVQGDLALRELPASIATFVAGDLVAIICLFPLLAAVCGRHDRSIARRAHLPVTLLEGAVVVVTPVLAMRLGGTGEDFLYALLLPVAWQAIRRGVLGATAAAFAIAVLSTALLASHSSSDVTLHELQAFLVTLTLTGAVLGGVVNRNAELARGLGERAAELAAANQSLVHSAFHDPLTGLANRALFRDRVEHALALHAQDGHPLAVIFCDLDDFKSVNDTQGHNAGDELLVLVGERLAACLSATDTLARLGGDEFAILVEVDHGHAHATAAAVVQALRRPFQVQRTAVQVGISVGLREVRRGAPTTGAGDLLSQADIAMYAAKHAGKNQVFTWDASLESSALDGPRLRHALARAVAEHRIDVAYQPIVSAADGHVLGVEALARWTDQGEEVPASLFIPAAEESGILGALSESVLEQALARYADLVRLHDNPELRLSVNMASEQLKDLDFPERVRQLLLRHRVPAERLVLEVTEERLLLDQEGSTSTMLERLRALGLRIALDDFGAGYSGLAHLSQLPLDVLKIDRMFMLTTDDRRQQQLLQAVVLLAHQLDLQCVIEGVETHLQMEQARAVGCDAVQGFLTGRPERYRRVPEQRTHPSVTQGEEIGERSVPTF